MLPLKMSVEFVFFGWVTECGADLPGFGFFCIQTNIFCKSVYNGRVECCGFALCFCGFSPFQRLPHEGGKEGGLLQSLASNFSFYEVGT